MNRDSETDPDPGRRIGRGRHAPGGGTWLIRRCLALVAGVVLGIGFSGCASLPLPRAEHRPSDTLVAPPDAPLAAIARDIALPADSSAVWPLVQASFALDARLAMIRNATTSLDLQTYLLADDSVGRIVLRELRNAALRGVRVRLLVDDLYTVDTDRLLLGLAATPNVEVRLFNPVITERGSSLRRLLALAVDFKRLNHRMHNKLFIADGAVLVVGGRNLADEYFLRGSRGNFIDFDLLATGAVVPQLSRWFDLYWNSEQVFALQDVVRASSPGMPASDALRADFERVTREMPTGRPPTDPPAVDFFTAPPFSRALAERQFHFLIAQATSFADSPAKIDPAHQGTAVSETLTHRFLEMLGDAKSEVLMFSPYFIPGDEAMARLRQLRADGVKVRVVTNSLAVSDEPLVNVRFEKHQIELLKMGIDLYEMSSVRLKLDHSLRGLLGSSIGRLHAKLAFVDRSVVYLGSMNLDPRSAAINTEIGVRVESPQLAHMIIAAYKVDSLAAVYQVKLRSEGSGVHWTAIDDGAERNVEIEPETTLWQRLHLMLLALFVPEKEL